MRIIKTLACTLLASPVFTTGVSAASITWSSVMNAVDTDVSSDGTAIEAANFGGTDVPDVTVNGVFFKGIDFPGGGTLTNIAGLPYNNFQTGHATATGGQIDTLFDTIGFLSGDSSHTIDLTGLESGKLYKVQFFLNHPPTATRTQTFTNGGGDSILVNNGPGYIITGDFTADASTQTITFQTNQGSQLLNGYQLRLVPEPTSLALLGLGGLLLARRRQG